MNLRRKGPPGAYPPFPQGETRWRDRSTTRDRKIACPALVIFLVLVPTTSEKSCVTKVKGTRDGSSVEVEVARQTKKSVEEPIQAYEQLLKFCKAQKLGSDHCDQLEVWWNSFLDQLRGKQREQVSATERITLGPDAKPRVLLARNLFILRLNKLIESSTSSGDNMRAFYSSFAPEHRIGRFIHAIGEPVIEAVIQEADGKLQVHPIELGAVFSVDGQQVDLLKLLESAESEERDQFGRRNLPTATYTVTRSGFLDSLSVLH